MKSAKYILCVSSPVPEYSKMYLNRAYIYVQYEQVITYMYADL